MQRLMIFVLSPIFLSLLPGCGAGPAGSQQAAQSHFEGEFEKWIAGVESEVTTMASRTGLLKPPISYDIRSITDEDPDPLAFDSSFGLPENWEEWPAYKFNVVIEWESEAGSPLENVTTYRLTWNTHEQKWYVNERF